MGRKRTSFKGEGGLTPLHDIFRGHEWIPALSTINRLNNADRFRWRYFFGTPVATRLLEGQPMLNRVSAYFVLTIALLLQASSANAQNGSLVSQAERISGDHFTVVSKTPKGATVYAVNPP